MSFRTKQAITDWDASNISECIQEPLYNLKQEVFVFHTTDNFDETQIIVYLEQLYDLTIKHIKSNQNNHRSIFDIHTIIDTLFYLINAQVRLISILKRIFIK